MKRFLAWLRSWLPEGTTIQEEVSYSTFVDNVFARSLQYKADRDELLKACKLLLCIHYGHWGPLGEGDIARFALMLVEKADGRTFDPKPWILESAKSIRFED